MRGFCGLIHSVFDLVRHDPALVLVRFMRRQLIQIDFLNAFDTDGHAIEVKLRFLTTTNSQSHARGSLGPPLGTVVP